MSMTVEKPPVSAEKFNPRDKKYKRVADLPEPIRKKYVNLPKDGFIRKAAAEFDAEHSDYKESTFLHRIILLASRHRQHELAAEKDPIDMLKEQAALEIDDQVDIEEAERWEEMKRKLTEMGHTGYVEKSLHSSFEMRGEIDGIKFWAYRDGGMVNDVQLSQREAEEIVSKYEDIAFDRDIAKEAREERRRKANAEIDKIHGSNPDMNLWLRQQLELERREAAEQGKKRDLLAKLGF